MPSYFIPETYPLLIFFSILIFAREGQRLGEISGMRSSRNIKYIHMIYNLFIIKIFKTFLYFHWSLIFMFSLHSGVSYFISSNAKFSKSNIIISSRMSHYFIINTELWNKYNKSIGLYHINVQWPKPGWPFKMLTKLYPTVADLIWPYSCNFPKSNFIFFHMVTTDYYKIKNEGANFNPYKPLT